MSPDSPGRVRESAAMIAGMAPVLDAGTYHFCLLPAGVDPAPVLAFALASFAEEEGLSLILSEDKARALGVATDLPMRRITLSVLSALDGVGLTAAVAGALAQQGISCNMVAAYHHDHAFVPASDADRALRILQQLAGATDASSKEGNTK